MSSPATYMLKRLERMRRQAEVACMRDVRFRSLCDDYGVAAEALERWKASSALEAAQRILEYQELTSELEEEILDELRRFCDSPDPQTL